VRGISIPTTLDRQNHQVEELEMLHIVRGGVQYLAELVRGHELKVIERDEFAEFVPMQHGFGVPSSVINAFNWFAMSVCNYLRLVALVELLQNESWSLSDLKTNEKTASKHCGDYVKDLVPSVYLWRNKVSAHFAATDPRETDSPGVLHLSIMDTVSYSYPRLYVGGRVVIGGEESELPRWSVTEVFESLSERLWPGVRLAEIPAPRNGKTWRDSNQAKSDGKNS
jgi:hypothetical protein